METQKVIQNPLEPSKKKITGDITRFQKDLTGQVIIITGCNSGIGKETALQLAKTNATIIMACRDPDKTFPVLEEIKQKSKNNQIEFIKLDLSDLNLIDEFVKEFKKKYKTLNVLINNAAVSFLPQRKLTKDGFEMTFGTNHLGHFYLTLLLLDLLKISAPSRVVNVASEMYLSGHLDWDDLMGEKKYSMYSSYAQSKLANILFTRELQSRIEKDNVKVVCLHPGIVGGTEAHHYGVGKLSHKLFFNLLLRPLFHLLGKSVIEGAQTSLYCALEDYNSLEGGAYYSDCRVTKLKSKAKNQESQRKLWEVSEQLIGSKNRNLLMIQA